MSEQDHNHDSESTMHRYVTQDEWIDGEDHVTNALTLNDYQEACFRTVPIPDASPEHYLGSFGLGIAGEAGEVADLLKKHLFHGHPLDPMKLKREVGDVLWYCAAIGSIAGFSLADCAQTNIEKLVKRYPNGFSKEASINRKPDDT